jgi:hypothetical protein
VGTNLKCLGFPNELQIEIISGNGRRKWKRSAASLRWSDGSTLISPEQAHQSGAQKRRRTGKKWRGEEATFEREKKSREWQEGGGARKRKRKRKRGGGKGSAEEGREARRRKGKRGGGARGSEDEPGGARRRAEEGEESEEW